MSKVADYLLMPPADPPILIADDYECPHQTVIMTKLNDESILVCEDCGEEVEI